MKSEPVTSTDNEGLKQSLGKAVLSLKARVSALRDASMVQIGDARRAYDHARRHDALRRNRRSRDNLVFAFGSNAEVCGYLDVDELALCGLEANGGVFALWLARCAWKAPTSTFATYLREILSSPGRLAWCRAEGARARWHFSKRLYDVEHANWRSSAKSKDAAAAWRRRPITKGQSYMIDLICAHSDLRPPSITERGEAHDWIEHNGGHPRFWDSPKPAPEWSEV